MRFTLLVASAALTAFLSLPALAAEDGPCGGSGDAAAKREAHKAEILARFDADKDGKLSKDERAAAKAACEAKKAEHAAKREAKEADFKAKHPKAFAKADRDGDGDLSDGERLAAVAKRMKEKHPEAFAQADSNGDGALTKEELKAFHRAHRADCK